MTTVSQFPSSTNSTERPRADNYTSICSSTFHKAELPSLLVVAVVSNLVATVTLAHMHQSFKTKTLWILSLLAGNDLFTSTDLLLLSVVNMATCNSLQGTHLCNVLGWLGMSSLGFSLALVALISIERYLMVVHPIFHHLHCNPSSLLGFIGVGLTASLLLCGLPLVKVGAPYMYYKDNRICGFDWSPWRQRDANHATLVLFNALYLTALVVVVVACNVMVHRRLHRRNQVFTQGGTMTNHSSVERVNKFSFLAKVVAAFNCVCTLPFAVKLMVAYGTGRRTLENLEDSITSILIFCTPIVNPLLYCLNKTYRNYLLNVVRKFCRSTCVSRRIAPQNATGLERLPTPGDQGAAGRGPVNIIQLLPYQSGTSAIRHVSLDTPTQITSVSNYGND